MLAIDAWFSFLFVIYFFIKTTKEKRPTAKIIWHINLCMAILICLGFHHKLKFVEEISKVCS
jgi:hypothetical protein